MYNIIASYLGGYALTTYGALTIPASSYTSSCNITNKLIAKIAGIGSYTSNIPSLSIIAYATINNIQYRTHCMWTCVGDGWGGGGEGRRG